MSDYIEREAVMQKFADHVKRSNNSDFAPVPTWNQAVQIVEDSPAADVRPVVRGKWIKHNATHVQKGGMYLECSCCHEYITVLGHVFDYCPNCGADMREES